MLPPSPQLQVLTTAFPLLYLAVPAVISRTSSPATHENTIHTTFTTSHPSSRLDVHLRSSLRPHIKEIGPGSYANESRVIGTMSIYEARRAHAHREPAHVATRPTRRAAGDRQDGPGYRATSSNPGVEDSWLRSPHLLQPLLPSSTALY